MALNIKNKEVERIAVEVSKMTGKSMTGSVLTALQEYKERLSGSALRKRRLRSVVEYLEEEVWSIATVNLKQQKVSDDELLGYGKGGA
jgi:antitoxin VapB